MDNLFVQGDLTVKCLSRRHIFSLIFIATPTIVLSTIFIIYLVLQLKATNKHINELNSNLLYGMFYKNYRKSYTNFSLVKLGIKFIIILLSVLYDSNPIILSIMISGALHLMRYLIVVDKPYVYFKNEKITTL